MLCVFSSLEELTDCFSTVETSKQEMEMLSFRARHVNNQTIYGVICSNASSSLGKTLALNLGICTLPNEEHKDDDWSSSFDSISAQLSSNNKSLVVQNNKFVLDSIIWPKLGTSEEEKGTGIRHGKWAVDEIKSLHDALNALSLDDEPLEEEYYEDNNEEGGWVKVVPPPPPTAEEESSSPSAMAVGSVRSYRNALLTAKTSDVLTSPERKRRAFEEKQKELRNRTWTAPRIQLGAAQPRTAHELTGKLYMHQLKEKGIEEPSNITYEEDESPSGSFFQSAEYGKGSVSLTRHNNATKLRPAMLEKKLARIAAKPARDKDGKVIVPGNEGSDDDDN